MSDFHEEVTKDLPEDEYERPNFNSRKDSSGRWTLYDDIDFVLSQLDMSHAQARNILIYAKTELRACQRKIVELTNEINDATGRDRISLPHIPFSDPKEHAFDDVITISERSAKSLLLYLGGSFLMIVLGALGGLGMFLIYLKWGAS